MSQIVNRSRPFVEPDALVCSIPLRSFPSVLGASLLSRFVHGGSVGQSRQGHSSERFRQHSVWLRTACFSSSRS